MSLPVKTTLDDIQEICRYLSTKPTGSTLKDAKAVIETKRLDGRKLSALKKWELIEELDDGRLKVTPAGRDCIKSDKDLSATLTNLIRKIPPYAAIIERAAHRHEDSLTATEVAAHWHDHFKQEVGDSDETINNQAICFFHVASGAGLGTLITGRKGAPTRFSFNTQALRQFIERTDSVHEIEKEQKDTILETGHEITIEHEKEKDYKRIIEKAHEPPSGRGIFIAHGKNKKPLEQLKKILDQFRIPYKVAVEEPNLGRPISGKIREIMLSCNCAILIFTTDEEFRDKDGNIIWRPSENVVFELGATGFLYDNRIVIMKEDGVNFPTNFQDIGYISFEKDRLEAKTMDILKELIGFGIVKIST
jgi:predicted nucleotide-binding protein